MGEDAVSGEGRQLGGHEPSHKLNLWLAVITEETAAVHTHALAQAPHTCGRRHHKQEVVWLQHPVLVAGRHTAWPSVTTLTLPLSLCEGQW